MLVEELSEGLESTQNTNARDSCNNDIAFRRNSQCIRFVDSTSECLVDISRIGGILLDPDAGDVYL